MKVDELLAILFIIALLNNLACLFSIYKLAKLCNLTSGFLSFFFDDVHSTEMKSFIAKVWLFKKMDIPNNGKSWLAFARRGGILNTIFIYIYGAIITIHNNDILILIIWTVIVIIIDVNMYKQFNKWIEQA